jgi:hypothetical protein
MEIFALCGEDNEAVDTFIGTMFSKDKPKRFVGALVVSLLRNCCLEEKFDTFDIEAFKHRSCLLHKYIGQREEMELEALFAIEFLDFRLKHPPGESLFN